MKTNYCTRYLRRAYSRILKTIAMEQCEYDAIFQYITNHVYAASVTLKQEKRLLRQKASSFLVVNDVLMHKGRTTEGLQIVAQVLVGNEGKERVLKMYHDDVIGGCHTGQNATLRKISERYWWRSMSGDVRDHVRQCQQCQRANPSNRPPPATLHPVKVQGLFHRYVKLTFITFITFN